MSEKTTLQAPAPPESPRASAPLPPGRARPQAPARAWRCAHDAHPAAGRRLPSRLVPYPKRHPKRAAVRCPRGLCAPAFACAAPRAAILSAAHHQPCCTARELLRVPGLCRDPKHGTKQGPSHCHPSLPVHSCHRGARRARRTANSLFRPQSAPGIFPGVRLAVPGSCLVQKAPDQERNQFTNLPSRPLLRARVAPTPSPASAPNLA